MILRGEKSLPVLPVALAIFFVFPIFGGSLHAGDPPGAGTGVTEQEMEDLRASVLELEQVLPSLTQTGKSTADQWIFADKLLKHGLPSRAIPILEAQAGNENGPNSPKAWEALQRAYYRQGDYQKSLGAFFKVSTNRGDLLDSENLLFAGNSYLQIGEYGPAIQILEQVPKDHPYYPFALYSLGLAGIRSGQETSLALKPLEKLIKRKTEGKPGLKDLTNQARLTAGLYLKNQRAYSDSVDMFASIDTGSRFRPAALYGMGAAYVRMEDCVKALVVYEELAREFPVSPYGLEASIRIGRCFARLNAYRTSVARYREALGVLNDEKTFLEGLNQKIKNREPVPPEELSPRFSPWTIRAGLPGGVSWSEEFQELKELRRRLARIEAELEAGKVAGQRAENVKQTREKLEGMFDRVLGGEINKRISWLEELIQEGTLQVAKNIVVIQSYDPSP